MNVLAYNILILNNKTNILYIFENYKLNTDL